MARSSRWQTLMVAIGTIDTSAQPLLHKAVQLADRFGMAVQLLHVVNPSYRSSPGELEAASSALRNLVMNRRGRSVDIDTTMIVVGDRPVADAIVREVLEHKPDVLLVESHRRGKLARVLLREACWE